MNKGFYIGMKVSLNNEYGIVIKGAGNSDWESEPGIIRWDSSKEFDQEDWRGLFGSFLDAGGKEISPSYEFRYINDNGELK